MMPVLAGADKAVFGLPDLTDLPADEIVKLLATGRYPGAVILDEKKREVATKLALETSAVRGKFKRITTLGACDGCNACRAVCPVELAITEAVRALHMEIPIMAREFARRVFIVVTSGCAAMAISIYKNEEWLTPYEEFHDTFDRGCIVNVGLCLADAHIVGAAVKIASIFSGRDNAAIYAEIADYILNIDNCGI